MNSPLAPTYFIFGRIVFVDLKIYVYIGSNLSLTLLYVT
jgi:hypothetical protein